MVEGLYTGLGSGAALTATQLDAKMKLLVEAPAAVEDALASLLDHADATLQALGTALDVAICCQCCCCVPGPALLALRPGIGAACSCVHRMCAYPECGGLGGRRRARC